MTALFTSCTAEEAPSTSIVPPALFIVELEIESVPPLLASSVPPVFVRPPEPLMPSVWPERLASMVPPGAFMTARPPFPMRPAPWIVLLFVRVVPPTLCSIMASPVPEPL